jgi:hypothetical protein
MNPVAPVIATRGIGFGSLSIDNKYLITMPAGKQIAG